MFKFNIEIKIAHLVLLGTNIGLFTIETQTMIIVTKTVYQCKVKEAKFKESAKQVFLLLN
jgi:hypothetical protein